MTLGTMTHHVQACGFSFHSRSFHFLQDFPEQDAHAKEASQRQAKEDRNQNSSALLLEAKSPLSLYSREYIWVFPCLSIPVLSVQFSLVKHSLTVTEHINFSSSAEMEQYTCSMTISYRPFSPLSLATFCPMNAGLAEAISHMQTHNYYDVCVCHALQCPRHSPFLCHDICPFPGLFLPYLRL